MSGRTPKSPCGGAHRVEVRNSTGETSRKNREVSSNRTTTIPNVVKIDRYAQAVRKTFMTRSLVSLARLLRFHSSAPDLVPSALIANENPPKPRGQKIGDRLRCPGPQMLQADGSRHKRLLGLLERRLHVAALGLTVLGEHGASGAVLVLSPRCLLQAVWQRHVLRGLHQTVEVLLRDVEVHKVLDGLVVLQRVGAHVDEQRAGEQVLAAADGVFGGLDAVNGERPQRMQVILVVRVPEVAERVRVSRDTLHEHVVVLAHLHVGLAADLFLVCHDDLVEVLVGARLGAGAVEAELPVRPLRAYLAPLCNLAFGGRLPDLLELLARDVRRPVVALLVNDDRDAIVGNRDLNVFDPVLLAQRHLLGHVYRPGGVRDLGVALAEGLEAVTGSRAADLDARIGVLLSEKLRRSLGDRVDGARTFDLDVARDSPTTILLSAGTAPATCQDER